MAAKQALVFGASGISGWAIVRECLSHPSPSTFSRIVALSKKPLSKNDFLLPEEQTIKLETYGGIDLTAKLEELVDSFKKIPALNEITHVYYTGKYSSPGHLNAIANLDPAYAGHGSDFQTLKAINITLFNNAIHVVTQLCPALEFVVHQTGGKTYGIEFYGQPGLTFSPPLRESAPRIPEPYASNIFYYPQQDAIAEARRGQNWSFFETRPDMIVGFTPRSNGMGFAQAVGLWLALYASFEGKDAEVVFPGSEAAWKHLHNDTSQDILARFTIHASLSPSEQVDGKAFNIADEVVRWETVWPEICSYFGLKGVGPQSDKVTGADWVRGKKTEWAHWVEENGLQQGVLETTGWGFMMACLVFVMFDRHYDLTASKTIGFSEPRKTAEGYYVAFDRMRKARMIP